MNYQPPEQEEGTLYFLQNKNGGAWYDNTRFTDEEKAKLLLRFLIENQKLNPDHWRIVKRVTTVI